MKAQPDRRIKRHELGSFTRNGKRFVVNIQPGVPRNACIEEFDGYLRCWACYEPLDDDAAQFVRENATFTDNNAFVWNDGVEVPETQRG